MSRYLMVSDDYDDDDAHCDHQSGDCDDDIKMTMTRLTTLYRAASTHPLCETMMINDDCDDDNAEKYNDDDNDDQ